MARELGLAPSGERDPEPQLPEIGIRDDRVVAADGGELEAVDRRDRAAAAGNVDLGSVTLLPPTLTLQYHFNANGRVRPYVGAGVNFTHFFNEDLPTGGIATSIQYDDSFGLAAQAGIDFDINDVWFFNVDVKKIDINTDVTINGAIQADVDIDPWVFGIGFGRRF